MRAARGRSSCATSPAVTKPCATCSTKTSGNGTLFQDADNNWGNNAESSRQSAAADAAFGAQETWDFYKQKFNRNGIRNNGVGAPSRVHYDTPPGGAGYDNAFWNDDCFCMTYGDGNVFAPLVALDVAGHEMSHGVTSNTAGLIYLGESGGLNEATSDIFGSSVEFAANNAQDRGDYYIGEEIAPSGFLRRMDKPHADGSSYNCYTPLMGLDDVHFTSGVANRFFYLLSEGTGNQTIGGLPHQGQTCNGTTINEIGRAKADQIWYRALNVYMTAGSNYQDARDATIRAARDKYGKNSVACKTVMKTWTAVKVKPQLWACNGQLGGGNGNALKNGGFEAGQAHWNADSGVILDDSDVEPALGIPLARSGSKFALLNFFGSVNTQHVQQTVNLPNSRRVTLVYSLMILSNNFTPDAGDKLKVQVKRGNGSFRTIETLNASKADQSYHRHTENLSQWRDKRVIVRFVGQEDGGPAMGFVLDDLKITRG